MEMSDQQEWEVDRSLEMLEDLGSPVENWIMWHPSGSFDDSFLDILRSRDCANGLTTRVDIADLFSDDRLLLPRLDTNDLPRDGAAAVNEWTSKVVT